MGIYYAPTFNKTVALGASKYLLQNKKVLNANDNYREGRVQHWINDKPGPDIQNLSIKFNNMILNSCVYNGVHVQ